MSALLKVSLVIFKLKRVPAAQERTIHTLQMRNGGSGSSRLVTNINVPTFRKWRCGESKMEMSTWSCCLDES